MAEIALEVEVILVEKINKKQLETWVSRIIIRRFTVPKGLFTLMESVHNSMSTVK